MLMSVSMMTLWLTLTLIMPIKYELSLLIMTMILLSMMTSSYMPMVNSSFVSVYGSTDTTSTMLMCLSVWITMMMLLVSLAYKYTNLFPRSFTFTTGLLMLIVVTFFLTDNMLLFYITFESSLLPTLFLIMKWGYQPERLQAGMYFMMYTVCGSLPLLFAIMFIQSSSLSYYLNITFPFMSTETQFNSYILSMSLLFAFLVKTPMWGVHLWLPKAHVEAPVSGSMILAGILLKLGGYGLMKINLYCNTMPYSVWCSVLAINLWGMITVSMLCLSVTDMKMMVAYSSIIHMGMMVVGILSGSSLGQLGAILMMITHGLSSPGLFSMVNFNYETTGSRNICLQKGMSMLFPTTSMLWFMLLMSNMAAPPSANLVSELMVCVSMLKMSGTLSMAIVTVTFLAATYNLYLYSCQSGEYLQTINFNSPMKSNLMLSSMMLIIPIFLMTPSIYMFIC